jgi:hypothetical protein
MVQTFKVNKLYPDSRTAQCGRRGATALKVGWALALLVFLTAPEVRRQSLMHAQAIAPPERYTWRALSAKPRESRPTATGGCLLRDVYDFRLEVLTESQLDYFIRNGIVCTALGGLVHYPPQVEISTNEWRTIEHAMRARRPLRAPSLYMAQVRIIQKNRIWQTDLDAAHDPSPPSGYSSNFLATPLNAGDIVAFGLKP